MMMMIITVRYVKSWEVHDIVTKCFVSKIYIMNVTWFIGIMQNCHQTLSHGTRSISPRWYASDGSYISRGEEWWNQRLAQTLRLFFQNPSLTLDSRDRMMHSKVRLPYLSQRNLGFEIRSKVSETHNFLDTIQSVYFVMGVWMDGYINTCTCTTLTQDSFSGESPGQSFWKFSDQTATYYLSFNTSLTCNSWQDFQNFNCCHGCWSWYPQWAKKKYSMHF